MGDARLDAAIKRAEAAAERLERAAGNAESPDKREEWKECRTSIGRFDSLLVDLRKTGFGFVTAVVGVATFVFKESTVQSKLSIFLILVVLIVTLYLIDRVHQIWLLEAVARARELEGQIGYSLSEKLGSRFSGQDGTVIGFWLYFVLLATTAAIFWAAIPERALGGHQITLYGISAVGFIVMVGAATLWAKKPQRVARATHSC